TGRAGEQLPTAGGGTVSGRRPLVVALGTVDPELVTGVLGDAVEFVARPGPADLAEAEGAIVRAEVVVDAALLARAPRLRVLAHDPVSPPPAAVDCPDLGELAAASDVLTLHAPLTEATRHLVDAGLLARTRPGAVLVNCGRGGLLDLDAALAALESGRLGGV